MCSVVSWTSHGSNTVTVTFSGASYGGLIIQEYGGVTDTTTGSSTGTGTTALSGSVTSFTPSSISLVVGFAINGANTCLLPGSAGTDYTLVTRDCNTNTGEYLGEFICCIDTATTAP